MMYSMNLEMVCIYVAKPKSLFYNCIRFDPDFRGVVCCTCIQDEHYVPYMYM